MLYLLYLVSLSCYAKRSTAGCNFWDVAEKYNNYTEVNFTLRAQGCVKIYENLAQVSKFCTARVQIRWSWNYSDLVIIEVSFISTFGQCLIVFLN